MRLSCSAAGPVLFQLPPQFKADRERLASFLKMLSRCQTYAFEFRDKSWYGDDILELLREYDIALCLSDHRDAPSPWEVTARHVYLRGHGPGGTYRDHYSDKTLRAWARDIENGSASAARSLSISTTTRYPPRRRTPCGWWRCWGWAKRKAEGKRLSA